MQHKRMIMAFCALIALSSVATAGVPKTVSYQGRLTNSGGTTVPNGTYSVRFTLFHDAVGGGGQWTEVQPVSIADGLFSAELGAVNPLPDTCCFDTPWLEIAATIGGLPVTMSPRMHMASTPSALYSGGVFGEATSGSSRARGIIAVKSPSGSGSPSSSSRMSSDSDDNGIDDMSAEMMADNDSASLRLNGLPPGTPVTGTLSMSASGGGARQRLSGRSGSTTGTIRMAATPDSAVAVHDCDSDGDGVPESEYRIVNDGGGKRADVLMKGRSGSTTGTIRMAATPDSAVSVMESDADGDGIAEARGIVVVHSPSGTGSSSKLQRLGGGILRGEAATEVDAIETRETLKQFFQTGDFPTQEQLVDASGSTFRAINTKGTGSNFRVALSATDSASSNLDCDSDGDGHAEAHANIAAALNGNVVIGCATDSDDDGIDDNDASLIVTPTTSSVAIQTKGTGADKNRTIGSTTYPDSAVQVVSSDEDGDGNREMSIEEKLIKLGLLTPTAVHSMVVDSDDDGTPDNSIESRVTPTTSSLAIKTKGTGAQRFSAGGDCDDTDASLHADFDADNDGVMESSISQVSDSGGTDHSMRVRLDSTPARISTNMTIERQTKSASFREIADLDGDGLTDMSSEVVTDNDSASFRLNGLPPGTPYIGNLSMSASGGGAHQRLLGRSGSTTGTIRMAATPDSAVSVMENDVDNDGHAEISAAVSSVGNLGGGGGGGGGAASSAYARMSADSDDDGVADMTAEMESNPDSASFRLNGLPPGTPYIGNLSMRASGAGASQELSGHNGSTTGTIRMAATPDSAVFDLGYHGSTTGTIRMQASSSSSVNPIEHSSGAHLTSGGDWTNASDKKLKENFEQVDGLEILEKIEGLPVSEWNYKVEGDDIKHIGPTAQDFSDAFGLGNSDKTISTIDPSGVALVAIKELTKQNKDLKKKNSELENKLNDLQKQIEKLASAIKK